MKKYSLLLIIFSFSFNFLNAQQLKGYIKDDTGNLLIGANVYEKSTSMGSIADENGFYSINIAPGTYTFIASFVGCIPDTSIITIQKNETVMHNFILPLSTMLNSVVITSDKDFNNVKHMEDIEGALIFAGKRNDVVILDKTNANTAENIPRQVFSKVPGVYEWDLDGSGTQTSISVRGLNPHRSWEFNVRQNGYSIASDEFGYPECHYGPATEALKSVQLVRGGACLQYGPQFG
ncbi:MAG TPA: carboxypeptidase-like regulatory domain-containing protein, partial [Chitinophagales bacterium]|nr:carboxypeptidase-like regulatory domain-containing protein [Chitinophagales bacterium]